MSVEAVDTVLIGTGVGPLVAATRLLAEGRRVLLINPDPDFFLENSELAVDPEPFNKGDRTWDTEQVCEILRPHYPGAIEQWPSARDGFRDEKAPHVRTRSRLRLATTFEQNRELEDQYLRLAGASPPPQWWEGLPALARFPGARTQNRLESIEAWRGLGWSKSCDVDVDRYRSGLLTYVRERLGSALLSGVNQLRWNRGELRYYNRGSWHSVRPTLGLFVFVTSKLLNLVRELEKSAGPAARTVDGQFKTWEQWSVLSRDPIDPHTVGTYRDLTIWTEIDGMPVSQGPEVGESFRGRESGYRLSVLRPAPLGESEDDTLSELFFEILGWDRFSLRRLQQRRLWADTPEWYDSEPGLRFVTGVDGFLPRVVDHTTAALAMPDLDFGGKKR